MSDRCIQGLDAVPDEVRGCVLTIGNFDGVHAGHQRIIAAARALADVCGADVVALTFEPPPDLVLRPSATPMRIAPPDERCCRLARAGADWTVTLDTTPDLLSMPAKDFIEKIILERFAPTAMVEGHNFFFGRKREGTIDVLRQAGRDAGFDVQVVEPLTMDINGAETRVSSTLVRQLITAGRVADAARCLGFDFVLYGHVVGGYRRGRLLDYPTANLDAGQQITPGDGIYAGFADVQGGHFPAAISIGDNPTFGPTERTIEAFLLNAEGDFYDETMSLSFVQRIRDQERFADAEALKTQITQDVQRVREICE